MHLAFLRDYHEAQVLALARTRPVIERGTVAEFTGLTPQAASKVLARLLEEGVIEPAGVRRPALGKPAAVYRLVPESRWAIGAHVTRRNLRLALTDLAGDIHDRATTPLPADFTPAQLLSRLAAGVTTMITRNDLSVPDPADRARRAPQVHPADAGRRAPGSLPGDGDGDGDGERNDGAVGGDGGSRGSIGRNGGGGERNGGAGRAASPPADDGQGPVRRLAGVGIGMIGPLDQATGTVRDAHRLRHWHDIPLADLAATALGLPVVVDKDVTAAVTAEAWRRGPAFRDAALIMVESGVGAGLWLGGAAHRGAHTNAGEFGHAVVQLDGPRCACGRRGCLEAVHDQATDPAVAAAVLGVGVVNLLQTLDLGQIVLAGADLLAHGELYRDVVEQAVRTQVPRADWLTVEVSLTSLGTDVIAAGAAMQVLNSRYGLPAPTGLR
ncbi:ROK family transcriptional regulator [Actinoplanes sp. NPDC026670]|uniref:ROK family transcriptional regulator n=1 Tax=Actinoplanes sp. NPDC026670 TaxID=3154700 RepID=UPI0033F7C8EB